MTDKAASLLLIDITVYAKFDYKTCVLIIFMIRNNEFLGRVDERICRSTDAVSRCG